MVEELIRRIEAQKRKYGTRKGFTEQEHSALESARVVAGKAHHALPPVYTREGIQANSISYLRFERIARAMDWH